MDQQGSTPGNTQGDPQDHSPQNNPADNAVDEGQQPSQENHDDGVVYSSDDATSNQGSGAPSQPAEGADDTQDDSQQGDQSQGDDDSGVDPELTKWAASQNISLETPTEIALAKRLRDTQRAFHEGKQKDDSKQKFEEAVNEGDDTDSKLSSIEGRLARADFFEANPDAREIEGAMFDYAVKLKESGDEEGFKYYSSPQGWPSLYRIVKAEQASNSSEDSYESGRKDERTNLAKAQQAGAPPVSANNSAPSDNKITDEKIGQMSMAEYEQFKKDNPDFNPFAF